MCINHWEILFSRWNEDWKWNFLKFGMIFVFGLISVKYSFCFFLQSETLTLMRNSQTRPEKTRRNIMEINLGRFSEWMFEEKENHVSNCIAHYNR